MRGGEDGRPAVCPLRETEREHRYHAGEDNGNGE